MDSEWEELWSQSKKRKYFFNKQTGKSAWRRPNVTQAPAPAPLRVSVQSLVTEQHYDAVTMAIHAGAANQDRGESQHLRAFNNWIKAWLIDHYGKNKTVLDLACGRGQDLQKWAIVGCKQYVGVDISHSAVAEAARRSSTMDFARVFQFDLASAPLPTLVEPSDVVTCMFALHYFWASEHALRSVLSTVVANLKRGGHFVLTLPTAGAIKHHLLNGRVDGGVVVGGNNLFTVSMDVHQLEALQTAPASHAFGWAYNFTLPGAVQGCREFMVPMDVLMDIATQFGLHVVRNETFHEVFYTLQEESLYHPQLYRMRVIDNQGSIPQPQWEAAGLYTVLVFRLAELNDNE